MKQFLILIGIFITSIAGAQPYINQDVYNYYWLGVTSNIFNGGCTILTKQYERFAVGMSPIPQHSEYTQFTNSPNCYSGILVENRWTWSDVAMNNGTVSQYWDGVYQSGSSCSCVEKRPKLIREGANYGNKTFGSTKTHRQAWAETRFWINAVTNGLYHIKVKMNGGYWDSWWPGSLSPGDISSAPIDNQFDYVNDVKIRGINCNAFGEVTFYWNPYGGVTLDCTPLVIGATKNAHYWYSLEMTIIP